MQIFYNLTLFWLQEIVYSYKAMHIFFASYSLGPEINYLPQDSGLTCNIKLLCLVLIIYKYVFA
jgi:hypothetical protein